MKMLVERKKLFPASIIAATLASLFSLDGKIGLKVAGRGI